MNWATYIKFMNKIEMFTRKKENTGDLFDRKHNWSFNDFGGITIDTGKRYSLIDVLSVAQGTELLVSELLDMTEKLKASIEDKYHLKEGSIEGVSVSKDSIHVTCRNLTSGKTEEFRLDFSSIPVIKEEMDIKQGIMSKSNPFPIYKLSAREYSEVVFKSEYVGYPIELVKKELIHCGFRLYTCTYAERKYLYGIHPIGCLFSGHVDYSNGVWGDIIIPTRGNNHLVTIISPRAESDGVFVIKYTAGVSEALNKIYAFYANELSKYVPESTLDFIGVIIYYNTELSKIIRKKYNIEGYEVQAYSSSYILWSLFTELMVSCDRDALWRIVCEREQELSKLPDGLGIKVFELVGEYTGKLHNMEQVK